MDNFLYQSQLISEIINNKKLSDIKKDYKEISSKYRAEKINSSAVVSTDKQALSYLSSRMGETSVIIDDVFSKLNYLIDINEEINSVLDLGSGTGSVFWALDNFASKLDITAVEMQESMIKYSKLLSKNLDFNIEYLNADVTSSKVKGLKNFDLVIESFMLNEMKESDRRITLDLMCEKSNKYIVLIEPGTPNSYEKMMKDREYLLSKNLKLLSPCPHKEKCGLKDDYCNFSVRVNRTKESRRIKDATLNYEDEKYFYLIFSKVDVGLNINSVVLRKPVYRKNLVELKLCNKDSSVMQTIVTKNNKESYQKSKKLKHGDLVDFNI